jgi:hypothetical protein
VLSDDAVAAFARWSLRCLPQLGPVRDRHGLSWVVQALCGSLSVFTVLVTGAGAVRQR